MSFVVCPSPMKLPCWLLSTKYYLNLHTFINLSTSEVQQNNYSTYRVQYICVMQCSMCCNVTQISHRLVHTWQREIGNRKKSVVSQLKCTVSVNDSILSLRWFCSVWKTYDVCTAIKWIKILVYPNKVSFSGKPITS